MKIDTKLKLIAYTRTMLGSPQIECEVSDAQISQIIDDAVQKFTEFAYGTLEATITVQINGKGTYHLPENVTHILKISRGSTGSMTNFASNYGTNYVPDLWSQQFFTSSLTGGISSGTQYDQLAELKNNYSNLEVQYNETGNKIYMMDNITLEREFVNAQVELVRVKNDISDVESALSMGKQASEVDKRLQLAKDDLKIAQEAYNSLSVK